jgi:hypothetical protein
MEYLYPPFYTLVCISLQRHDFDVHRVSTDLAARALGDRDEIFVIIEQWLTELTKAGLVSQGAEY